MCYNKYIERAKEITTMPAMTYVVLANAANATPMTAGQTAFVVVFSIAAFAVAGTMIYNFHKNF
jgi:hypothetical protein